MIGHIEWAEFVRVPRMPRRGEIVHATETWEDVGGGGAVAAVQLAKLAGGAVLFTTLGADVLGRRSRESLESQGVEVRAAGVRGTSRRVVVHIDDAGERTITVIGERMGPRRRDQLRWPTLKGFDGVYFTAGDLGTLRAGRQARVLVASSRAMEVLVGSGVTLDALVGSASDTSERYEPGMLDPPPELWVDTQGAKGGRWLTAGGSHGRFKAAQPPGPIADAYGCGDSFAAGLAFALASGVDRKQALSMAARCGAASLTGRGPFGGQLRLPAELAAGPLTGP